MPKDPVRSVTEMLPQSIAVLSAPSVSNFERFERRGGLPEAAIYVILAALVSAVIGGLFALMPWHKDVSAIGAFLVSLIIVPLGFFTFTGLVYFVSKNLFKGNGTFPEVAYTFALFYVPLSIAGTIIGIIPVIGWLANIIISALMVYFGYLAVQSSMNIREMVASIVTLVVSTIGYLAVTSLVTVVVMAPFAIASAINR